MDRNAYAWFVAGTPIGELAAKAKVDIDLLGDLG
jgi:hypothetical protein